MKRRKQANEPFKTKTLTERPQNFVSNSVGLER